MKNNRQFLGLDIGHKRIGLAWGNTELYMAWPLTTLAVDDSFMPQLQAVIAEKNITDLVVGRPRNQEGQSTPQTESVEQFTRQQLAPLGLPLHWQDESLTSVFAQERLDKSGKQYNKAAIDTEAATIILQDYLERIRA